MDLRLLKDFLVAYSLPTVTVAAVVAIITFAVCKICKDKIPLFVKNYLPFVLSIVCYVVYDMIATGAFVLNDDAVCAGILSGSLSTVLHTAIGKIGRGESIGISATVILIESLISGYIDEELVTATALSVDSVITENGNAEDIAERIADILKENSSADNRADELKGVAELIIQSVKSLKEN